ncbi:MAG: hypothetical protein K2X27_17875 [Candidatus Obscuribacterales bacterium]|nr:hypothetical protein [Candidatus Obscuribacterales bacterium]
MSLVHKVIILNKPLKIRGFTFGQWALLAISVALGFFLAFKVPQDVKVPFTNLPMGLIAWVVIVGGAVAGVNAAEFKPFAWWRNLLLYKVFNAVPRAYFPHVEEQTQIYPDPDVIDPARREEEGYIELEM